MKGKFLFLAGALALHAGHMLADPVSDWNETAVTVMSRVPTLARGILYDLVYVHVAVYDAVNAIDGRYAVFAVSPPNAVPWASEEAAVAAAAHRVLSTFYPPQKAYLDSVYDAAIQRLPHDSTTTRGIAIGDTVAALYLAQRVGDRREATILYEWKFAVPGVYQPTPPGAPQYQPLTPWAAQMRPFALDSASELRAPEPPSLLSDRYLRDFKEVKRFGSLDSSFTTLQQREIARFWTENPNLFLARSIRDIARESNMLLPTSARYFAQMYVTIGDALITGFNSKYFYNRWRPVTAIRQADTDRNPVTDQDTSWVPLVATPPHPEYPAAHGCGTGGLAYALREFFGTNEVQFTLTSTVTGSAHYFATTDDLNAEVTNARVWGGMHFRNSVEAGMDIAREVAEAVAKRFKPVAFATAWKAQKVAGLAPSVNPHVLLSAPSENVCWGVRKYTAQFIKTTNGGISWTSANVQGATGLSNSSIAALDENTAWVAMYGNPNETSGGIFKTTDGGTTWTKQTTAFQGSGGRPTDVRFFDSQNGVVIGLPHGGNWEIYTTSDGGTQWVRVPVANLPVLAAEMTKTEGLHAASGNSIWFGAYSDNGFALYRSKNRGQSWEVTRPMPDAVGFSVAFKDSLNGFAVSSFLHKGNVSINRLAATTDGGVNWTLRPRPFESPSTTLISYVPGSQGSYVITAWANIGLDVPTSPGSAYTTDNGETWIVADNLPHGLAAFASPSTGWSSGNGDVVYRWGGPVLAVEQLSEGAQAYRLEQNYPNPFNPKTEVRFQVPGVSDVKLVVYDILGREVATLVNERKHAGTYEASFDAAGLASGVYIYRLTAGSFVQSRRMILLK